MSFWDYQPEEYEQYFLSQQEEAVKNALSSSFLDVGEYELSVKLIDPPDKLSIYIQPHNTKSNIWTYVDSEGLPLLREWMEDMSDYSTIPNKKFNVVGDGISFIISYTHVGSLEIAGRLEPIALIQYLGWDFTAVLSSIRRELPLSSLVVPIRTFLSDLYNGILEAFSKGHSPQNSSRDQFYSMKSYKLENNLSILEDSI